MSTNLKIPNKTNTRRVSQVKHKRILDSFEKYAFTKKSTLSLHEIEFLVNDIFSNLNQPTVDKDEIQHIIYSLTTTTKGTIKSEILYNGIQGFLSDTITSTISRIVELMEGFTKKFKVTGTMNKVDFQNLMNDLCWAICVKKFDKKQILEVQEMCGIYSMSGNILISIEQIRNAVSKWGKKLINNPKKELFTKDVKNWLQYHLTNYLKYKDEKLSQGRGSFFHSLNIEPIIEEGKKSSSPKYGGPINLSTILTSTNSVTVPDSLYESKTKVPQKPSTLENVTNLRLFDHAKRKGYVTTYTDILEEFNLIKAEVFVLHNKHYHDNFSGNGLQVKEDSINMIYKRNSRRGSNASKKSESQKEGIIDLLPSFKKSVFALHQNSQHKISTSMSPANKLGDSETNPQMNQSQKSSTKSPTKKIHFGSRANTLISNPKKNKSLATTPSNILRDPKANTLILNKINKGPSFFVQQHESMDLFNQHASMGYAENNLMISEKNIIKPHDSVEEIQSQSNKSSNGLQEKSKSKSNIKIQLESKKSSSCKSERSKNIRADTPKIELSCKKSEIQQIKQNSDNDKKTPTNKLLSESLLQSLDSSNPNRKNGNIKTTTINNTFKIGNSKKRFSEIVSKTKVDVKSNASDTHKMKNCKINIKTEHSQTNSESVQESEKESVIKIQETVLDSYDKFFKYESEGSDDNGTVKLYSNKIKINYFLNQFKRFLLKIQIC